MGAIIVLVAASLMLGGAAVASATGSLIRTAIAIALMTLAGLLLLAVSRPPPARLIPPASAHEHQAPKRVEDARECAGARWRKGRT